MVNRITLISSLNGIVGFRQPLDSTIFTLDTANKTSRSGYYVNDDPFVKLDVLRDCQDYSAIDATGFNALLTQLQNKAITDVVNAVFSENDYIERNYLYPMANNKTESNQLSGFVGYKIETSKSNNVNMLITRALLEFEGTGSIQLLLYDTLQSTPIATKTVTITSKYQFVTLNWDYPVNKEYRLGYIASGSLKPYEREYQSNNIPNIFTHIRPLQIQVPLQVGTTLWDLDDEEGLSEYCGVNLDITIYKDFTELLIQNEQIFANAINLQCVCNIIDFYVASERSNIIERLSADFLARAIVYMNGQEEPNVVGLTKTIANQVKLIKQAIKRLKDNYQPNIMNIVTLS